MGNSAACRLPPITLLSLHVPIVLNNGPHLLFEPVAPRDGFYYGVANSTYNNNIYNTSASASASASANANANASASAAHYTSVSPLEYKQQVVQRPHAGLANLALYAIVALPPRSSLQTPPQTENSLPESAMFLALSSATSFSSDVAISGLTSGLVTYSAGAADRHGAGAAQHLVPGSADGNGDGDGDGDRDPKPRLSSPSSPPPPLLLRALKSRSVSPAALHHRRKRQCPECHLYFSNLATHKSTHLKPTLRPHVCKICLRGFARPNDLFRHVKCHWKEVGTDSGQFKCPFKDGPKGDNCCHSLGIFSRCDTYKNHLKAIHFQYPGGTKKSQRNQVAGSCRLCQQQFLNVEEWITLHIDEHKCPFGV